MDGNAKRPALTRMLVLAAVASTALALGAVIAPEKAEAINCSFVERVAEYQGYWAVFVFQVPIPGDPDSAECAGRSLVSVLRDANGNAVPVDQPKPGYTHNPQEPLNMRAGYQGDQVQTPYCVTTGGAETTAGCSSAEPGGLRPQLAGGSVPTWLRMALRPVSDSAPPGPLVDQPGEVQYQADDDNRVVRVVRRAGSYVYEDYYREWRENGRWKRSITYGSNLRHAQWNTWLRSQSRPLMPTSALPSATPPAQDSQPSERTACERMYPDLARELRDLICSGA